MRQANSAIHQAGKWILPLLPLLLTITACTGNKSENHVPVTGSFSGADGQMIRLSEMTTHLIIDVDSALVKNNAFRLSAHVSETSFFLLQFGDEFPITLVMSPGDALELTLEATEHRMSYQVEGNDDSKLLMEYYNRAGRTRKQLDSLRQVLLENQTLPGFFETKASIDATLDTLLANHRSFTQNLIQGNPSSYAAILLINKSFAGTPLFNIDEDIELFRLIDEQLMARSPENRHVAAHHRRVEAATQKAEQALANKKRTSPGQAVPAVKLPDPRSKMMALSDLKGTTVVLFFWASWSPESRADLQLLKAIYQQPGFRDFEVFAVSLDHKTHFWKAALDIEKTAWINVNEPSGLGGSLARLFNLPQKLPHYFVIDERGIIQLKTDQFNLVQEHLRQVN